MSHPNIFFDKIFVINLESNIDRYKKVSAQFKRKTIKVERFLAVDGRCKQDKSRQKQLCLDKLENFKMKYNVNYKITSENKNRLPELTPAASLTLGTILILRNMVKNKYKHVLICEDDINLTRRFMSEFKNGISELNKWGKPWDLLYLGSGGRSGFNGVSRNKSSYNKYTSPWSEVGLYDDESPYGFVHIKDDLRIPAEEENELKVISHRLTQAKVVGGTWCYAYSLRGAKKVLKLLNDNILAHIDQVIMKAGKEQKLNIVTFDPPIVFHESIRGGRNSDIPW